MDAENGKIRTLSTDETHVLLSLIESSKIVNKKTLHTISHKMKNEEWTRISESFNATALSRRTPRQLRLKWKNLKTKSRKRSAALWLNSLKADGGPTEYIPPNDILDRVATLLGSGTTEGYVVEVGGDAEPSDIIIFSGNCDDSGDVGIFVDSDKQNEKHLEQEVILEASASRVTTTKNARVTNEKKNMDTPKANGFKRKLLMAADDERTARNLAIAATYSMKKKLLDTKLKYILLENEKLKLKIAQLKGKPS